MVSPLLVKRLLTHHLSKHPKKKKNIFSPKKARVFSRAPRAYPPPKMCCVSSRAPPKKGCRDGFSTGKHKGVCAPGKKFPLYKPRVPKARKKKFSPAHFSGASTKHPRLKKKVLIKDPNPQWKPPIRNNCGPRRRTYGQVVPFAPQIGSIQIKSLGEN